MPEVETLQSWLTAKGMEKRLAMTFTESLHFWCCCLTTSLSMTIYDAHCVQLQDKEPHSYPEHKAQAPQHLRGEGAEKLHRSLCLSFLCIFNEMTYFLGTENRVSSKFGKQSTRKTAFLQRFLTANSIFAIATLALPLRRLT